MNQTDTAIAITLLIVLITLTLTNDSVYLGESFVVTGFIFE